jgi:hypothetical protein
MTAKIACFTAALVLPAAALAWGAEGHRIVAALAYAQLTPIAKAKVDALLSQEPGSSLESISTWADEHKSPATARWHFINFPRGDCHYQPDRDCPDGECAVPAIEREREVLATGVSAESRLKSLKYLTHVVGDIHQPLHAGWGYDKGGNKFQVRWDGRGTNLHHVWDVALIEAVDTDPLRYAKSLEHRSLKHSDPNSNDPVQWAEESCRIVADDGFYPRSHTVGLIYLIEWRSTLDDRLQLAGIRLADLLNTALK